MVVLTIEFLVLASLIGLFLLWLVWKRFTDWRLKKKYNPDNDEGKKGEARRQQLIREGRPDPVREIADAKFSASGSAPTEGRRVLQAAASGIAGEDSSKPGRSSKLRRIFRKK
jgi:hypothetical protein